MDNGIDDTFVSVCSLRLTSPPQLIRKNRRYHRAMLDDLFRIGRRVVGGSLLIVGFLSGLACVALLLDMLVAIPSTKLSALPKGLSPFNRLDDFLYLPEVLYLLFFIWLICTGPGTLSFDYWLAGKLLG